MSGMIKKTWVIEGYKTFPIYIRRYEDVEVSEVHPIKQIVHIIHGMSEYGGRYDAFASYLAHAGYIVYVHDHRRHGKSLGNDNRPGVFVTDSWKDMIEDIRCVQSFIQQNEQRYTMIMIGHSMGSFLVRDYLTQANHPIAKAILTGTGWKDKNQLLWGKRFIQVIERITPNTKHRWLHRLFMGVDIHKLDWLSSDAKVVTWYQQSKHTGFFYTPRFYLTCIQGIIRIQKESYIQKTPQIPLLIISGEIDPIGNYGEGPKRVVDTYRYLGYNAELEMIQREGHEVLNGLSKESVYERIIQFIQA